MQITYLSYYPHYAVGVLKGKLRIDINLFCLLLAQAADPEKTEGDEDCTTFEDMVDAIDFGMDPSRDLTKQEKAFHRQLLQYEGEVYALPDVFTDWGNGFGPNAEKKIARATKARIKKMLTALQKQGFFVAEWEEGTQAVALPGYEMQAVREMAKIEADHAGDAFEDSFSY